MATNFNNFEDISNMPGEPNYILPIVKTTTKWGVQAAPSKMTLNDLITETQHYLAPEDIEKIKRAYDLADQAHKGAVRRSGEPYIQHPLEVALLLAAMRIDADGIVSALLHDVVEDTHYSLEELTDYFGPSVANIVDSVTKFDALAGNPSSLVDKRLIRSETLRKVFVRMVEDPRVIVLKLADRLHNMRTLGAMSAAQQQNTARETSEFYAPLASRLGMELAQADLEDLAFGYLEPEKYMRLSLQVEEEVQRRLPFVNDVCRVLREEMQSAGIKAEVVPWQKHLASINRKLEESGGDLSRIHDLISFRILVDTSDICYLVLGHLHALWRPKYDRIKDFIGRPKLNGYQSLHTTVFCFDDHIAEIQIRTHDMQRTADYGIASYWYLKENDQAGNLGLSEMVAWFEQLRERQSELPESADEFIEAFKGDVFQDQIFVFTPGGEVKDLPRGSTPIDMAYRIHTDIGDHCAGARIMTNTEDSAHLITRLVPLDYELKDGEIVEIMVNRTVHPTRDWLSFARTAAARNKIRRYLKTYEREINLQLGRERLDFALKAAGACAGIDERVDAFLKRVVIEETDTNSISKKYATLDDIYVALGREDVRVEQVLPLLVPLLPELQDSANSTAAIASENGVYGYKDAEHLVQVAQCCCPIPGDEIIGLLMPNQGVIVHRSDCETLQRSHESSGSQVDINWRQIHPEHYLLLIKLVAHDRSGLLRDVAAVVADAGINMVSVTSTTNTSLQKSVITAILEIAASDNVLDQIERVQRRLRQVKTVVSVDRFLGK